LGNGVAIPSQWQDLRWLGLTIVLSVAAAFGLGGVSGWHRVLRVITHPAPGWFAVAFAAQAVALGSYALAYGGVVAMGGASLPAVDAATPTAAGFGAHLPRGGFGFHYGFLRSRAQSHERTKKTVMLLRFPRVRSPGPGGLGSCPPTVAVGSPGRWLTDRGPEPDTE
jgi:hypothetical protein